MSKPTTKPNVLGSALRSLRPTPPGSEPPEKATTALSLDKMPIGVMFRLDPPDHAVVSAYARDKQMSLQELLEHAINAVRLSDGLAPITGRPRSKTRRRRI